MEQTLLDFAHHLRLHASQYETPADATLLAQKLLCTQLPACVNYRAVYNHLDDDLTRVDFRTPDALAHWATQRPLSLDALNDMIVPLGEHQKYSNVLLNDFVSKVAPPEGRELHYLFLARVPNLYEELSAAHPDDRAERTRLHDALHAYSVDPSFSHVEVEHAAAQLLKERVRVACGVCGKKKEPEKPAEEEEEEEDVGARAHFEPELEAPASDEKEFRRAPYVQQYKEAHNLMTKFPSAKVQRQMLSCALFPREKVDARILGKRQQPPTPAHLGHMTPADWTHLLDHALAHLTPQALEALVGTPEARAYYGTLRHPALTQRQLVRALCTLHAPVALTQHAPSKGDKKYLKTHPELSADFKNGLLAQ